jgi:transglutaminase-like putative cysteine protease/tetratricopeptide (TPR) repeat protein
MSSSFDRRSAVLLLVLTLLFGGTARGAGLEYRSEAFGYSVKLPAADWRLWAGAPVELPGAEWGASLGDRTFVAVMPVCIDDIKLDGPTLARAMLSTTALRYDQLQREPIVMGPLNGEAFKFELRQWVNTTRYRGVIVSGRGYAFLVIAWTLNPAADEVIDAAVTAFDFSRLRPLKAQAGEPAARAFDAGGLAIPLRVNAAMVLNEAGVSLTTEKGAEAAATSAALFERSYALRPDPVVARNLLFCLRSGSDAAAAVQRGGEFLARHPGDPGLLSEMVLASRAAGRDAEALPYLRQLIERPEADEDTVSAYLQQLVGLGHHDESIAEADRLGARFVTQSFARLRAMILINADQAQDAVALLDPLIRTRTADGQTVMSMANALVFAKQPERALAVIDGMPSPRWDANTHLIRGHALMALKRYDKAKAAYEAASQLEPGDPSIAELVKAAANAEGVGQNLAVAERLVPVRVADDLLKTPELPAAQGPNPGYAYLLRLRAIEFLPEFQTVTTDRYVIRVDDQRGADANNSMTFPFKPLEERIYVNSIEVRDNDGKLIRAVAPEEMFVQDVPSEIQATHESILHVPVSGIRPPCRVHVTVTRKSASRRSGHRLSQWTNASSVPVGRGALVLSGKTDAIRAIALNGVKRTDRPDGILFESPSLQMSFEPLLPDPVDFTPMVIIGPAGGSWRVIAHDYLSEIADRLQPDESVAAEARSVVAGARSPADKLAMLSRFVQKSLTYRAVTFGPHAMIPQPAGELLRVRVGDCKDHALLLNQMLRAVDIDSYLALVNSDGPVEREIASMDQFDHMIVYVPDRQGALGGDRWIDLTGKCHNPLERPGLGTTHDAALVLDPTGPELLALPPPNGSFDLRIDRTLRIETDGQLRVEDHLTLTGMYAAGVRRAFWGADEQRLREAVPDWLGLSRSVVREATTSVAALEDVDRPLTVDASYTLRRKLRRIDGRLVGDLPTVPESLMAGSEDVVRRTLPFAPRYSLKVDVKMRLQVPPGWRVEALGDGPLAAETPHGTAVVRFDSKSLTGSLEIRRKPGLHAAADWPAYAAAVQAPLDAWNGSIVVRPTK